MARAILIPDECREWTDSVLVQPPLREQDLKEPTVLVRRVIPDVAGPRNEQVMYLPGGPVISLFTGAGGMDLGVEMAGFCTVVQHEWNPDACATLIANRPKCFRHAALIQGDLRQTTTSMILREGGLRVGEAHLLVGGPPCQGFSTANVHALKHKADDRNDLVFEYLRVIREARPQFFMMENVPGIFRFNGGEYVRQFLAAAHESYYELVYGLVDCVEYGVPQYRTRFICMGTRRDLVECDGLLAALPPPQNFSPSDLERLSAPDEMPLFPDALRHSLTRAPGIRYFPDRPVLFPPSPRGEDGRQQSFLDFYDRLEREEPDRLVLAPMSGGLQ